MGKIIKTKQPVQINTKVLGDSGVSEVLYYEVIGEQRAETAEFKGQTGLYVYLIDVKIMDENGQLVKASTKYPALKEFQAVYKLSTWMYLFGAMTPAQIDAQKQQLMIEQFAYNASDYGGLGLNDYEPYNP